EIGVFRPLQQGVDQLGALILVATGQERLHLIDSWQNAAKVQVSPADKFLVRAQVRRLDAEHLELGEDEFVDVVVFRRVRPLEALARLQVGKSDRLHDFQIPAQNGDLAALTKFHKTFRIDVRHGAIAAAEYGQPRDIADGAIGEGRQDRQLLPARRRVQHARTGQNLDLLNPGQVRRIVAEAFG